MNYKSQGNEKLERFSQGICIFLNVGNGTLVNAYYECVKVSSFTILHLKYEHKGGAMFFKYVLAKILF